MKKNYIIGSVAAITLSLSSYALGQQQGIAKSENRRVAYVDQSVSSEDREQARGEELTPEQVSAKENSTAEQIVIKITDQGYVTSHGDHYHYYNGKVPYDAIISEELIMNDPAYQLQEADIVNDVKDGYIIKVNGRYYLYLKNKENPTNVRSKERIEEQRRQYRQGEEKASQPTSGALAAAKQEGRYTTDDGYVFQASDIIEDTGDAYIVPHGNHFHYIPKSDLSPDELRAAQAYWNGRNQTTVSHPTIGRRPQEPRLIHQDTPPFVPQPAGRVLPSQNQARPSNQPTQSKQPSKPTLQAVEPAEELLNLLKELYSLPLSQRYVEEDGLVFDPTQISNRTDRGVVVPHGNHHHFIPYNRLSDLEQRLAKMIPLGQPFPYVTDPKGAGIVGGSQASKPTNPTNPPKPNQVVPAPTPSKPDSDHTAPRIEQPILLAPKKDVSVDYQEFYQAAYQLIASAAGEKTDKETYEKLNRFITELNGEPTDKVGLIRAILSHLALVQYPERSGKPNSKIVYTAQEIQVATLAGMYATSDGYIFDAKDIISDEGEGYLAPHINHSHYIPKKDLSTREQEEARLYVVEAGLQQKKEEEQAPPVTGEKAMDIYNRVVPAKLMPVADMPYHSAYVVDIQNGQLIIPHHNHYHNLPLYLFDTGLYEVPAGYTMEQFLATVKYYVLHPEDRPVSDRGFGISSNHGKVVPELDEDDASDSDDEVSYEPDEYAQKEQKLAGEYGMSLEEFRNKLYKIVLKYDLSIENFNFHPEQKTLSFIAKSGQNITISLETLAEVPANE